MISLKQLIDEQKFTGEDDLTIIRRWFCENDREEDGIDLITKLSKSKFEKANRILTNARQWIPNRPKVTDCNPKSKISKADKATLDRMTDIYLLGMDLSEGMLIWAQENIPNMECPGVIFVPMVEWLSKKYGIEFKDYHIENDKGCKYRK